MSSQPRDNTRRKRLQNYLKTVDFAVKVPSWTRVFRMIKPLHCIVFCLLWFPLLSADLECYSCTNATSTKTCQTKIACSQGEKCYTSATGIGTSQTFELGCKPEKECLPNAGIGIVGRSVASPTDCLQCCQVDNCNRNLCSSGTPVISEVGACADDLNFDCAGVSSVFNICTDVHHAKLKCRKYCGLCNLVDGSWSTWSSWSNCDVTCGSGHMTRTRTCTNPAPAHGGLDCAGDATGTKSCVLYRCPVHGGWSSWTSWGHCSVTCGVGFQRRDRTCSNPHPSTDGDHCYGDSRDDRPCFVQACSDGVWSAWSEWGPCSATCSEGLQKRNRTCNNPTPSNFGHVCVGNDEEYQPCDNKNCSEVIAFRATTVSTTNYRYLQKAIFTDAVLNEGEGYDNTTGVFTAPSSGVYIFIVQICSNYGMYVNIVQDDNPEVRGVIQNDNCDSLTVLMSLTTGNEVWVTMSPFSSSYGSRTITQDSNHVNMFQGTKLGV